MYLTQHDISKLVERTARVLGYKMIRLELPQVTYCLYRPDGTYLTTTGEPNLGIGRVRLDLKMVYGIDFTKEEFKWTVTNT